MQTDIAEYLPGQFLIQRRIRRKKDDQVDITLCQVRAKCKAMAFLTWSATTRQQLCHVI